MIVLPDEAPAAQPLATAIQAAQSAQLHGIAAGLFAQDVQAECPCWHHADGPYSGFWWDTRPWISPHEHSATSVDMAQQAIAWAIARGVATRHPVWPHLIRVPQLICQGH